MANIKVTVDDKSVSQRLQQLLQVVDKPRPLMLQVAETLHAQSMAMFEQQGFPVNSWPSLRPSTIRSRSRAGHWPGKILQVTGRLAASVTPASGDDFAQIGSNLVYAAIQHLGGTIKRQGQVRLRTDRQGNLMKRGNLATFARRSHKQAVARAVNYSIVIRPRPFLPVTDNQQLNKPAFEAVMGVLNDAFMKSR
ncbi:TPA: phage virion morphogenesis protein [Serratia marcescens]|nr:phage virion morphogenesis protein [Serratia marcescens]ELJ5772359.1 phage virion morphogenesis protein [Serratia marcescens]ELJ5816415.1 phage virion morphogenesis protein [Serratia marcescens]ELN8909255.1 phage virion morphogenesis protein [Serratia marcescens]ELT0475115.1 phage virion morphogenesis protein [Serratia marcescens]EMB2194382.1 phage virion morphogenesis protein [Serratia marcescens]